MQRKAYITPKVTSEAVSIGVFGCYGSGNTGTPTWGSWWKPPKRRRRWGWWW